MSPHWMRHNRNTRLKKRLHPAKVQQYTGHDEMEMTDHYTEYDPEEVQGILGEQDGDASSDSARRSNEPTE